MDIGDIERPEAGLVERFRGVTTPTLSNAFDSLGIRGVMTGLAPVGPGMRVLGTAVTVFEVAADIGSFAPDEARLEEMLDIAAPGDVLVIDNGGARVSSGGDVFMHSAKRKGLAGMVVDGAVRDREGIVEVGFPVFSRHVVPITGRTRVKVVAINRAIRCDLVLVRPGDIIAADGSGVAVVPRGQAEAVLELAQKQEAKDRRMVELVASGLSQSEAKKRLAGEGG